MAKIIVHDNWPIHSDITNPPHAFLPARKPLWQDLVRVDIRSQLKENWKLAHMVSFFLVDGPTIWQPGFNLPQQQRSLLNLFWIAQGYCGACKKKWNQAATDLCLCGEKQTMFHIVDTDPLTKLNVGLFQLHSADDEADELWLLMHIQEACQGLLCGRYQLLRLSHLAGQVGISSSPSAPARHAMDRVEPFEPH